MVVVICEGYSDGGGEGCDADEDTVDGGGKGAVDVVVGGNVEYGKEV